MRLRWTPQFRELIHRLDSGKTVWSVTDWFMQPKNLGDLSGCTFSTAYQYIGWCRGFTTSRSDTVATCLLPIHDQLPAHGIPTNSLDDGFRGHPLDLHDDGLTRPIFHVSPLSICSCRARAVEGMVTRTADRAGVFNHDFPWMMNRLAMTSLTTLLSGASSWHRVSNL